MHYERNNNEYVEYHMNILWNFSKVMLKQSDEQSYQRKYDVYWHIIWMGYFQKEFKEL